MTLLVLGSAGDDHPWRLAARLAQADQDVAVVTPADLSRPGWRLRRGCPSQASAAIGDRLVAGPAIAGVVNALAWIAPPDLAHVSAGDRDYVAQEMMAFLLAWMAELDCPIIERPTPLSLAGCGRVSYEWAAVAGSVGVGADANWTGATVGVTVVAGRAVHGPRGLTDAAQKIAGAAHRSLVTLLFADIGDETEGTEATARSAGAVLVGADLRPEVGHDAVADALLDWFKRR